MRLQLFDYKIIVNRNSSNTERIKRKQKRCPDNSEHLFVGLLGFEPRKTGPESVVLPLHHSPIVLCLLRGNAAKKKLGYSDSNQEKQDQNLLCYHYTIAQYLKNDCRFLFDAAKVQLFWNMQSIWLFFSSQKHIFPLFTASFKQKFSDIRKTKYICPTLKKLYL